MDKFTVYAALNTKIRVLKKEFIKPEDYLNLLKQKSVADAFVYLKENTAYHKLLQEIIPETVSRRDIEDILKRNMVKNIDRLIHFFQDDYKKLIRSLYMKYEIEDLKILARSIFNNKKITSIEKPFTFLGKYSQANPAEIMQSNSIRDLIYSLKGSYFYDLLIPLADGRRENLFRLEMALDMGYFAIIQNRKLKISAEDRTLLEKWEGMVADLFNIQWIYRGKKFYNLSPEELLNYTINFGDKLTFQKRKEMCYTQNIGELLKITSNTSYGFLFKEETVSTDIFMERRINRYLYHKLKELSGKSSFSIIQTIEYVWLLEFEIRDIISIIESIRYELPAQEARKFLVKAA
ncbi:MAG: V-type ATPase subunit [Atribacterota bacterium]|nr:V-type ATPase subunit [Atribacterota bacterium]